MLFKIFQLGRVNDLILRSKLFLEYFYFLCIIISLFYAYYVKSRISSFTIQIYRQIKAVSNVLHIFVEKKNLIFVFQRNHIIIKKYLIFVETENISGF